MAWNRSNLALRAVTRAARERPTNDVVREHHQLPADEMTGPEEHALAGELRDVLRAAMAVLPPAQRTVLVLRYYLQLDEREMAAVLGRPAGTVKWRLHAARQRLRAVLSGQGVQSAPEVQGGN